MISKIIKSIILVLTGLMLFSCENSLSKINEITQEIDTLAAITTYDINYKRSDSGYVQVELRGPLMKRYVGKDEYNEFPDGFEITFFDKDGNKTSYITAEYGVDYRKRKYMNARNNVIIKNFETQEELYTENLVWNQKTKIIKSNTFVKMITPDKIFFGDSMLANEDFTEHRVFNIRGEFEVEDKEE